jgi:hypothetical protein
LITWIFGEKPNQIQNLKEANRAQTFKENNHREDATKPIVGHQLKEINCREEVDKVNRAQKLAKQNWKMRLDKPNQREKLSR